MSLVLFGSELEACCVYPSAVFLSTDADDPAVTNFIAVVLFVCFLTTLQSKERGYLGAGNVAFST